MTREEIKKKKKELAIKIAEEIIKFEKETNVEVSNIGLDVSIARTETGLFWEKRMSVDIYLKNPYED